MRNGTAVVLREPVIVAGSLFGADLLPKGTKGIIQAENGRLVSLAVDGVLYRDIPMASIAEAEVDNVWTMG